MPAWHWLDYPFGILSLGRPLAFPLRSCQPLVAPAAWPQVHWRSRNHELKVRAILTQQICSAEGHNHTPAHAR